MNQCDDLNSCSGHGVCNMRRCECFDGWTGPDCGEVRGGTAACWVLASFWGTVVDHGAPCCTTAAGEPPVALVSLQPARNGKSIPPWAIALIVLSSSALAGIFIIAAGYALQALGLAPTTPSTPACLPACLPACCATSLGTAQPTHVL